MNQPTRSVGARYSSGPHPKIPNAGVLLALTAYQIALRAEQNAKRSCDATGQPLASIEAAHRDHEKALRELEQKRYALDSILLDD